VLFGSSRFYAKMMAIAGPEVQDQPEAETCSICLSELEVEEMAKELACGHCYHAICLDEWLRRNM